MRETSGTRFRFQRTLRSQERDWNELASVDALWAVLSEADRQYGRWDVEEFFATGEREIQGVMAAAASLKLPRDRERALDFGCGVGRLTRALSHRFTTCVGVDIAPEMLAQARRLNADLPNCEFVHNTSENLWLFPSESFDFVYSSKVLQHLSGRSFVLAYIAEFLRVVNRDGLVVFQLPYEVRLRQRLQPRRRLYRLLRACGVGERWLYHRAALNPMKTISVPQQAVFRAVQRAGGTVARTIPVPEEPNPSVLYFLRPR